MRLLPSGFMDQRFIVLSARSERKNTRLFQTFADREVPFQSHVRHVASLLPSHFQMFCAVPPVYSRVDCAAGRWRVKYNVEPRYEPSHACASFTISRALVLGSTMTSCELGSVE